jgi:hypothetical protein
MARFRFNMLFGGQFRQTATKTVTIAQTSPSGLIGIVKWR